MPYLFFVEAEANPDPFTSTTRAFLVTASGSSQAAARRHARERVRAEVPAPFGGANSSRFVGMLDRDVFLTLGDMA
jgi:hypothetical protein